MVATFAVDPFFVAFVASRARAVPQTSAGIKRKRYLVPSPGQSAKTRYVANFATSSGIPVAGPSLTRRADHLEKAAASILARKGNSGKARAPDLEWSSLLTARAVVLSSVRFKALMSQARRHDGKILAARREANCFLQNELAEGHWRVRYLT